MVRSEPKTIFRNRDERDGNKPLHYAVSATHGENNTIYVPVLRTDPTAAEIINKLGKLPLHIALSHCCVSFDLVEDLVTTYPLGATLFDGEGYTPLHHACHAGVADIEIVKLLLDSAPKSIQQTASIKGCQGPLPLHLALQSPIVSDVMNDVVSLLIERYPDAARFKDPDTKLACLSLAIMAKRLVKVLQKLMILNPDSFSQVFEAMEEGESVETSSLHLLASIGPTYLNKGELAVLQRDMEYWRMVGELERAKIVLRATMAQGTDTLESCNEIHIKLVDLQQRVAARLEQTRNMANGTEEDSSCPDENAQENKACPKRSS